MSYLVVHELRMTGDLSNFDAMTDELFEQLLELKDAIDPDLAVNLADGTIDVQMVVEAGNGLDAQVKAASLLRTAIHALGGNTPCWGGWEPTDVTTTTRAAELAGA